jgi:AbrB family looped-hinge helix DNA binding protein
MEWVQVRKKFQITLPKSVREDLHLDEGDLLAIQVRDDELVLRPQKLIDRDQTWYWTPGWQAAERQADEDIKAGRVERFETADEAIAFLHERAEQYDAEQDQEQPD